MGLRPKPDWLGADSELEQELKEVERRILHQASLFDPGAETYVRYALEGWGKAVEAGAGFIGGEGCGGLERGDSGFGGDCRVSARGLANS